ncbi:hypothetical protein HU200_055317 [Digitaria exilis]|uniref:Uncharacterized protein n=1 Tax=Digitaria exilis TaxID=1010633 RepID=A0A835AJ84_9POAL|nr:hypothetical protein HU200_055317 [Digitaria exilis]
MALGQLSPQQAWPQVTRGHIDKRVEPSSAAQQEAHHDGSPDDQEFPSRSRVPHTLERKCPSRLPPTLEQASPSHSRPATLEGRHTGNSARGPATHSFHDMMARLCGQNEESLHHVTAPRHGEYTGHIRSRRFYCANYSTTLSVPGTPQASRKDPRRTTGRARRHPYPRVISLEATPELEGAIPARIVHGLGSTVHLATTHTATPTQHTRHLAYSRDIGTQLNHPTQGLGSSSPSPTLLVSPYYEQHETRCHAPLLDVRPHGRNQDKPLRPEFITPNPPIGASVSAGVTKSGTDT